MKLPNIHMMKDAEPSRTYVCFGGSIAIARAEDDIGQHMVFLGDTGEEHEIGLDPGLYLSKAMKSEVVLGFNKVESIDVLIIVLQEAKADMLSFKERKNDVLSK
jgi:hypothetical protein